MIAAPYLLMLGGVLLILVEDPMSRSRQRLRLRVGRWRWVRVSVSTLGAVAGHVGTALILGGFWWVVVRWLIGWLR